MDLDDRDPENRNLDNHYVVLMINSMISSNAKSEEIIQCIHENRLTSKKFLDLHSSSPYTIQSPVGAAVQTGNIDVFNTLIDLGFDVTTPCLARNTSGYYKPKMTVCKSVHVACGFGHLELVRLLVEKYGIDVNIKDRHSCNPLYYAIQFDMPDNNCRMSVVKYLVEAGANILYDGRFTALHHCAKRNRPDVAEYLINKGAPMDVKNWLGYTSLRIAVEMGQLKCAQVMLENRSDIRETNNLGHSLFQHAVIYDNLDMLKLLYSYNSDQTSTAIWIKPTLQEALCSYKQNSFMICRYLIVDLQVELDLSDGFILGKTAFTIALQRNYFNKINLLLAAGYQITVSELEVITKTCPPGLARCLLERELIPRSLLELCYLSIRCLLGKGVNTKVDRLLLPEKLKALIALSDIRQVLEEDSPKVQH